MRRYGIAAALSGAALLFSACTVDDLFTTGGNAATRDKVAAGLRAALEVGIDSGASAASRVNGYLAHKVIKILLPEDARQALAAAEAVALHVRPFRDELLAAQALVNLTPGLDKSAFASGFARSGTLLAEVAGLESLGDSLVKYMNRGAERAAPRSVPIFKGAIAGLTLDDALSLLNSPDSSAATLYLEAGTSAQLAAAYAPLVDSTLALLPLTRYWGDFRAAYNTVLSEYAGLLAFQSAWNANGVVANLPALRVDVLEPVAYRPLETESLGAWTTGRALDGLFWLVGEEEKEIRRDPFAYVRDLAEGVAELLGEVFGEIMDMPG